MKQAELSIVTPAGVRDGDPRALRGLTERRGAAVLAYTERVAGPGRAVEAAADAFAAFRREVVDAGDPLALEPERTLLRLTRYAAAAVAPVEVPLRVRLRTEGRAPCEIVPELLVARAERELTDADARRLSRHLDRCVPCRAIEVRFRTAEGAYRAAPDGPPPPEAAAAILRALSEAAPVRFKAEPAAQSEPDLAVDASEPAGQPTYEFDALPPEAFDLAPPRRRLTGRSLRPPGRSPDRRPGNTVTRVVLPILIVAVALLVALTIAGVFRA